ncbi:LolA-related protein [Ramlibacter sp. PS4R-6]|uniref:LolA-related protein n=1 Tax=Ramlibacter sp. PS4R-6 TaxID=3133438 RepID=UPI00309F2D42
MSSWRFPRAACALLLLLAGPAWALTMPELQRQLQAAAGRTVAFDEERESPWLASPVFSKGTMRSTPDALEKRIETPHRETWRLLADRIEWTGGEPAARKEILFTQAPALAPIADLMRNIVAGDFASLDRDFRIELSGDANAWRVKLSPRQAKVSRALAGVELQGAAGRVQVIVVNETNGQRTTTRLAY